MIACTKDVTGLPSAGHCWHDQQANNYARAPIPYAGGKTKARTEVCCHCGGRREVWLSRGKDPEHGAFDPSGENAIIVEYREVLP